MTVNAWKEYCIHLAITYKPSINGCEKVSDPYHTTYLLQETLLQDLLPSVTIYRLTGSAYKMGKYPPEAHPTREMHLRGFPMAVAG